MARLGTTLVFYVLLGLLVVDALFELSFVSATVGFLHNRAGGSFDVSYRGSVFSLHGKPVHFLLDQGHTSNGAAGTAIILVGVGGVLAFSLLRRDTHTSNTLITTWLVGSFLSMLLTLSALIYVNVVTSRHSGQEIDEAIASRLNNRPYPDYAAYPLDTWTPQNWFAAVLELDLVSSSDRSLIRQKLNVMNGWRWNLIPMFLLGLAVFVAGFIEAKNRQSGAKSVQMDREMKASDLESNEEEGRVDAPMLMNPPQTQPHLQPQPQTQLQVPRKPLPQ